jgi:hypothetical protein
MSHEPLFDAFHCAVGGNTYRIIPCSFHFRTAFSVLPRIRAKVCTNHLFEATAIGLVISRASVYFSSFAVLPDAVPTGAITGT